MPKENNFFVRDLVCLCAVVALGHLSACGSKSDSPAAATSAATYDSMWTNVFSGSCGTASCHVTNTSSSTAAGSPDMSTKELFYANVVGKKGSDYNDWDTLQYKADCVPQYFIAKSDASKSMVVAVLDSSVSLSPCQVKDHLTAPQNLTISATDLTNLKAWINAGAAQ